METITGISGSGSVTGAKSPPNATRAVEVDEQLNRIERLANRIEQANRILGGFVDRFHGRPQCDSKDTSDGLAGYIGQLYRAEEAVNMLENLAQEIREIG